MVSWGSNSVGESVGRDLIRVSLGLVSWSWGMVSWGSNLDNWGSMDSVGNNWGSMDGMGNNWGSVDGVGNNWGSVHSMSSHNWGMVGHSDSWSNVWGKVTSRDN